MLGAAGETLTQDGFTGSADTISGTDPTFTPIQVSAANVMEITVTAKENEELVLEVFGYVWPSGAGVTHAVFEICRTT